MSIRQTLTPDYQAVVETLLNYGAAIDSDDYDTLQSLFTADAEFMLPQRNTVIGGAAIAETIRQSTANRIWQQHFISVARVTFPSPGQAVTFSNMVSHKAFTDTPHQVAHLGACYFDKLVQRDGIWLIASKRLETRWTETHAMALS